MIMSVLLPMMKMKNHSQIFNNRFLKLFGRSLNDVINVIFSIHFKHFEVEA